MKNLSTAILSCTIVFLLTAFVTPVNTALPTSLSPAVTMMAQAAPAQDTTTMTADSIDADTLVLNEANVTFLLACRCTPDKLPE